MRLSDLKRAQITLGTLMELSFEILPLESIRQQAQRLIGAHRLRAADAFQLAAAIVWHQQFSGTASFVSLDDRLRLAAALEGFRVMPYSEEVHEPAFDGLDD